MSRREQRIANLTGILVVVAAVIGGVALAVLAG
jgi:hypothetical protein